MSGMADVGPWPKPRLVARRRSRCWKCDHTMTRRDNGGWWCRWCYHVVTYGDHPTMWRALAPVTGDRGH